MNPNYSIGFIGTGNVAWHMADAFQTAGYHVKQVYSRTGEHVEVFAKHFDCEGVDRVSDLDKDLKLIVVAVSDNAIMPVLSELKGFAGIVVHTSGSTDVSVFPSHVNRYGVIYPLQTFSKQRKIDFREVPVFIEGSSKEVEDKLFEIGSKISRFCSLSDSEQRSYLHLSAVFSCNFVNHLYHIAASLLKERGLSFEYLKPLIKETLEKALELGPENSQTGPALRNDTIVMEKHRKILKNDDIEQELYKLLSESINLDSRKAEK